MTPTRDIPSTIVVASDAAVPERFAAQELIGHFKLLGVEAQVAEQGGSNPAIRVGKGALPDRACGPFERIHDDGFLLYADGASVYVAGKIPRGTLFGCYEYIESLGLRWPGPGLPAEATDGTFEIAAEPEDGVRNPDFPIRGNNCYCPTNAGDFQITLETVEWLTRQRYNLHSFLRGGLSALRGFDESWRKLADFVHQRGLEFALGTHLSWPGLLMYEDKELFHKHPEYFPLRGGERRPSGPYGRQEIGTYGPDAVAAETGSGMSLCISNPQAVELIVQNLRKFLDEHPELDVMGMWPPDTKWEGCECPDCRKLVRPERMWGLSPYHRQWRSTPDLVAHLIGEVANRIRDSHPLVRILTWSWCTSEGAPQNVRPRGRFQLDHFYLPCFTHAIDNDQCMHHQTHPDAWHEWTGMDNVDFGWIHTGSAWALTAAEFPLAWQIKKTVEFLKRLAPRRLRTIWRLATPQTAASAEGRMTTICSLHAARPTTCLGAPGGAQAHRSRSCSRVLPERASVTGPRRP